MKFLLDTDPISILQKQSGPEYAAVLACIAREQTSDLAFCIVSFHEQVLGCQTYLSRARTSPAVVRGYKMLDRVLDAFAAAQVLPFDPSAAALFDGLVLQRLRVGTMDLRIASIALARGLILVTRNAQDFGKVPGLVIEDWTM